MCGIGGRTIAEAQANLTVSEVSEWRAYYDRFGSFNTSRHLRVEAVDTRTVMMHTSGYKPRYTREECLPQEFPPKQQKQMDIEEQLRRISRRV